MRPRVFPAEDFDDRPPCEHDSAASMRPRVFPAEDVGHRATPWVASRFNEAAGIPRGRHREDEREQRQGDASMRPRVFPAEDISIPSMGAMLAALQ